jgi:ankyrin repeat protein
MLEEIGKQNWEFAHRLFQCVAAASRPLRVEELAEFLAFDFKTETIPILQEDWREEDPEHAVRSTCSSLLAVVNVDGFAIIQFAHFSVKEYLTSERLSVARDTNSRFYVSMTPAHTIIAQACLSVLLHLGNDDTTNDAPERSPLVAYAAEHWVGHALFDGVSPSIQDAMERLFDPKNNHLAVWVQIYDPASPRRRLNVGHGSQDPPRAIVAPLHYAALLCLHKIARFLICDRSQDVNAQGFERNETPLGVASRWGHTEVARVLLEHGADASIRDGDGWCPLERAAENGDVEVVRVLLEHGADVKARDKTSITALHTSCTYGHPAAARVLLEHGADVNAKADHDATPLHWATSEAVVEVLLEYGADLNAKNRYNRTPLELALDSKRHKIARVLRENGASASADMCNAGPLHVASANGQLADVRALLENGADVNAKGDSDETPLHLTSDQEVALILFHYGADPNAPGSYDRTPLHHAMVRGCTKVVDVLLDHGTSLDSRDSNERTPLHLASEMGFLDGARSLLRHNADIHARDSWGMTPFEVASANRRPEVMGLLLDHGAVDHRTY